MPSRDAKRPEHTRSIPSPHAFRNRETAGPERAELLRERIERLLPRRKSCIEVAGVLPISDCGSRRRESCRHAASSDGPLNQKQAVAIGASCSKALIQRTQTENKLMALTKFGFIVTGDRFVQHQGTDKFQMKV